MPKAKSFRGKRRYARRGRFMRKRSRKATVNVNRALTPFSQRYITKLKYSDTFTLSGSNNAYAYRLNSVYDPVYALGGAQPYGFDQLAALYNKYRVISCSWNVSFYSGGSVVRVATIPVNEPLVADGTSPNPIYNMNNICNSPRSRWAIQIPGGNTKMVKGKCYLPSLLGKNKTQYMADEDCSARVTTDPVEQALLYVVGADIANAVATIQCTITLNYTVEWFDPNRLGPS